MDSLKIKSLWVFSHLLFCFIGWCAFVFGRDMISILPMLMLAIPAYVALFTTHKYKGLLFIVVLSIYATFIEATSVATGFPYGFFEYGADLGTKIFGLAPWTVSFGWVPLVIGAIALARNHTKSIFFQSLIAIIIMLWSDFVIDPGAIALSFWSWITTGPYYTVPWVNFLGWIFSGIVACVLFHAMFRKKSRDFAYWSTLSLSLGNAFWVGVTLCADMYLASFFGAILWIFIFWSLTYTKKNNA